VIHLPPLARPVNQLWQVLLDLSEALSVPWTLVLTSITTGKSTAVEPGSPVGAGAAGNLPAWPRLLRATARCGGPGPA
jgi:hypothetical protein